MMVGRKERRKERKGKERKEKKRKEEKRKRVFGFFGIRNLD